MSRRVRIITEHIRRYGLKRFIETGTFKGDTAAAIADLGVAVTTIELAPHFHAAALERFKDMPNVTCLLGDSAEVLPRLLKQVREPALLWLDGHYSGGKTAKGEKETPIAEEILAVYVNRKVPHVVLVDDARCFGTLPDYPTLAEFEEECRRLFPDRTFAVEADIIRILP